MKFLVIQSSVLQLVGKKTLYLSLLSIIVGFFWFVIELVFVGIIQQLLYVMGLLPSPSSYFPASIGQSFTYTAIIVLIFGFLRTIVLFLKSYINISVYETAASHLRVRLVNALITSRGLIPSHRFMELFADRVTSSSLFISSLTSTISSLIVILCLLLFCLTIAPIEVFFSVLTLGLLLLPLKLFNKVISRIGVNYIEESKKFNQIILESLKNIFILQVYQKISFQLDKAVESIQRYELNAKNYYRIHSFKSSYPQFLGLVVIVIIISYSRKTSGVSSANLLAFFYLFTRIAQSAGEFIGSFSELRKNLPSIQYLGERIFYFEKNNTDIDDVNRLGGHQKLNSRVEIELKSVSYSYESHTNVFNNFSAKFSPRKITQLKGESGAGKSTLLLLIFGILKPNSGSILINGVQNHDLALYSSEDIGYVGPDNPVIEGTLRDNIRYLNDKNVSDESIIALMKAFDLDKIDSISKDYLNTWIDVSFPLSTGQKQRISIIRALLRKPKILVLDEATSNLDTESENKVMLLVKRLCQSEEITVIAISHRENYSNYCDDFVQI